MKVRSRFVPHVVVNLVLSIVVRQFGSSPFSFIGPMSGGFALPLHCALCEVVLPRTPHMEFACCFECEGCTLCWPLVEFVCKEAHKVIDFGAGKMNVRFSVYCSCEQS